MTEEIYPKDQEEKRMKELKKKSLGWVLSCIVCLSMILSVSALAAETRDEELPNKKIEFSYNTAAQTRVRNKTNATSHYIYNKSGFNIWVRSLVGNVNTTLRGHAIIPTAERFIYNNVYERGYRSCRLDITTATSGTTGILRGVWSPDSVGNYPVANP